MRTKSKAEKGDSTYSLGKWLLRRNRRNFSLQNDTLRRQIGLLDSIVWNLILLSDFKDEQISEKDGKIYKLELQLTQFREPHDPAPPKPSPEDGPTRKRTKGAIVITGANNPQPPVSTIDTTKLSHDLKEALAKIESVSKERDSMAKESAQFNNALTDEREKTRTLNDKLVAVENKFLTSMIWFGIATVLTTSLAFLLGKRGLRFWTRTIYNACLVLDDQEKDNVVFADVLNDDCKSTNLRKYDREPLKEILDKCKNTGDIVFEVGVRVTPGRKEYIFRKAKREYSLFFSDIYANSRKGRQDYKSEAH
jgi:hypothetical protein